MTRIKDNDNDSDNKHEQYHWLIQNLQIYSACQTIYPGIGWRRNKIQGLLPDLDCETKRSGAASVWTAMNWFNLSKYCLNHLFNPSEPSEMKEFGDASNPITSIYYHIWGNKHPFTSNFRVPRYQGPLTHNQRSYLWVTTSLPRRFSCKNYCFEALQRVQSRPTGAGTKSPRGHGHLVVFSE
jgi:hypothetical protein